MNPHPIRQISNANLNQFRWLFGAFSPRFLRLNQMVTGHTKTNITVPLQNSYLGTNSGNQHAIYFLRFTHVAKNNRMCKDDIAQFNAKES
jgi:hypothetical protein